VRLIDEKNNITILVKNTTRPKLSSHRGRTWDTAKAIVNNTPTYFHYDSTWGHNFYFQVNEKWYSIPVIDNYDILMKHNCDFKLLKDGE